MSSIKSDKTMRTSGWVMTALLAIFLLPASVAPKFMQLPGAIESMEALGWSPDYLMMLGVIELACVVLILIPRTAVLGAILLTGLLGGAMASHIRADSPLFSHTLFSIYLGVFMWIAIWLREEQLRKLFPIVQK